MKRVGLLAAVLLCIYLVSHAEQINVLFGEAHDELNTISWERALELDADHPEFRYFGRLAELLASEFTLERGLEPLTSSTLKGFHVVVIASPMSAFSNAEIDALDEFVDRGGGLLVVQDVGPEPSAGGNQLAELFGLHYRAGALCSDHRDWDAGSFRIAVEQSSHTIVQGINEFQMNWGCSIEHNGEGLVLLQTDEYAWQDLNGNRRKDTGEPQGPLIVAVALQVNEGRVVFIGDNAFHETGGDANRQLFRNALQWLAAPASQVAASVIPDFKVDPDVTFDSVVQISDGPQELSTDIKFYPNTRRAKPGDTVYWTLDLGDLEGPFTIVPEMNNDYSADQALEIDDTIMVLPFKYEDSNIYVPFVNVEDGNGIEHTVFTTNVLGVLPELEPMSRAVIKLPSPANPTGETLNAAHVMTFDHTLLDTKQGIQYVHDQATRWISAGVNLVVMEFLWFMSSGSAVVHIPIYSNSPWPSFWTGTISFDQVLRLTSLLHESGLHVAWRYAVNVSKDYSTAGRLRYLPDDESTYLDYQAQIKPLLAEIAELAGAELFGLDTENPAFAKAPESISILGQVKSVYTGLTFGSTMPGKNPADDHYDLIYLSADAAGYHPEGSEMKDWTYEDWVRAIRSQIRSTFLPIIEKHAKPMIFETFADYDRAYPQLQQFVYRATLDTLAATDAPIVGIVFHEFLLSPTFKPGIDFQPFGHPAEAVMKHYFTEVIPTHETFDFDVLPRPSVLEQIGNFEDEQELHNFALSSQGGWAGFSISSEAVEGQGALRIDFMSTNTEGSFAYYVLDHAFDSPQDWRSIGTLNFWMKNVSNPTSLIVSVFDADGDRFTSDLDIPEVDSWVFYTAALNEFVQPDWADHSDGRLDLSKVVRFAILERMFDERDHLTWFDGFYLGGSLEWP